MKYMDIGCKVNCWECTRNCAIKEVMILSILFPDVPVIANYHGKNITLSKENLSNFFYFSIIDSLKPMAGILISQVKDPVEVNNDFMELAVSFYVARLKMIETSKT